MQDSTSDATSGTEAPNSRIARSLSARASVKLRRSGSPAKLRKLAFMR
jgi:hypothetical protein